METKLNNFFVKRIISKGYLNPNGFLYILIYKENRIFLDKIADISDITSDSFAKSPISALCFILALLTSRLARRRSRFNRANHCSVR